MTHKEVLDEVNVIYERLSHPEDCENGVYSFRDGNYLEALEVLIDFYETGLIEELEKIKAEIIENQCISCGLTCIPYGDCKYFDCIEVKEVIECLELIDKHISELKGE